MVHEADTNLVKYHTHQKNLEAWEHLNLQLTSFESIQAQEGYTLLKGIPLNLVIITTNKENGKDDNNNNNSQTLTIQFIHDTFKDFFLMVGIIV